MVRKAFTLIELLAIVAIIGLMATVAVMGLNAGKGAARMKGAARDIFATIRQARSIALITQQPAIITYSEREIDGEICAKVEITSTKLMTSSTPQFAQTLSGETIQLYESDDSSDDDSAAKGMSSEEFFFAPISEEVVKGVRIKVTIGDEELEQTQSEEKAASKISVFSNVDYLLGRYNEAKKKSESQEESTEAASSSQNAPSNLELQEEKSIVWEVNGRCQAHKVWIVLEGSSPEKGLCINIDRFGGAKILSGDEI